MNSQRQSGWGFSALPGAKPGKGGELAAFLQADRERAVAEQETVTWHVFKAARSHPTCSPTTRYPHRRHHRRQVAPARRNTTRHA